MSKSQGLTLFWLHGRPKGKEWVGICETRIATKLTEFLKNLHLMTCLSILERGEGREREGERNTDVREKHLLAMSGASLD